MAQHKLAIQDHQKEAEVIKKRAAYIFGGVLFLMSVLLGNLYHLQIVSFDDYQTRSNDNRTRVRPISPNRGLIYDRNDVLIAENRTFFSLDMIPEQVQNIDGALDAVSKLFELTPNRLAYIKKSLKYHKKFEPFTIINQLTEEQVAQFSVIQYKFPGLYIHSGLKRFYPYGESMTHVLGYVSRINSRDKLRLEKENKSSLYSGTHNIGKLGIERYYESILHGKPGKIQEEVNNSGRLIKILDDKPPTSGKNLHLTIDLRLQQKAVKLLNKRKGAVVALDPRNGEILALVSSPSYDPNIFINGVSNVDYNKLLQSEDSPLINRVTQGQYAPASTVKPHLALAALDDQIITPRTKIWDPGWWQMPGVDRRFRDWKKWGHGWVGLHKAITNSCDTFFYELAYKMGITKMSQFMGRFGFGSLTGIDMLEEKKGLLPTKEWKKAKYNQPWYLGDSISVGIGQGYWTVTPLQLAVSVAILANKGRKVRPHLLKAISGNDLNQNQHIYTDAEPITLKNQKHWDIIAKTMYDTAHTPKSSAFRYFHTAPYKAAVKSGTAQIFSIAEDASYEAHKVSAHLRDNALFIGWAPFEKPTIVIAVVVENAGWGASNAGPIVRGLFDDYLLRRKQ